MSKLECKDFTVRYFGYDAAISGVTTSFFDGINVIFAEEKGGKTTFLKALAGIVPYSGELTLDGEDISMRHFKDRDFQMLFDDYALFGRHSVRYNLEYPLKLRNVPKEERRARAEEAAKRFDLDLVIDAPVYRLNEWNKVCLVLCRASLRRAKVLLIDNIFSRLDPISRREAFLRFLPLFDQQGIVIYATDSMDEAAALTKKIKLLSYGYLLQEGSREEFRANPATLNAFLSAETYSTVLPCIVEKENVILFGRSFSAPDRSLIGENYCGRSAFAAFSPKDFSLSEDGFEAKIKGQFLSDDGYVFLSSAEGEDLFFYSDQAFKIGDIVRLVPRRVTRLFDEINQRSILRY